MVIRTSYCSVEKMDEEEPYLEKQSYGRNQLI